MTIWVQHLSGQGEKWEVTDMGYYSWATKPNPAMHNYYLPKSEYVECEPPERWVDVTADCTVSEEGALVHAGQTKLAFGIFPQEKGYRLRKIDCDTANKKWAFIVERKEPA